MSAACMSRRFVREGTPGNVWCELERGHDGPHAAWTWIGAPEPRVEWGHVVVADPQPARIGGAES
jgi:hypothetical protein